MFIKNYFHTQQLSFKLWGIDTEATNYDLILKRPLLCFVPLICAILHIIATLQYVYEKRQDYVEVTETLALVCQSSLAISKMLLFLVKRSEFIKIISDINSLNFKAGRDELPMIVSENKKCIKMCFIYFRSVVVSGVLAFLGPILESIYFYCLKGEFFLRLPYKGCYPLNYSKLPGYSVVYLLNFLSIYNLFGISMSIDTLFVWLVSNISAQFHILCFRFKEAGKICSEQASVIGSNEPPKKSLEAIKSCIEYHNQTLKLAALLQKVYREILFIKFLFSCSQVCCLVFRLSRTNESLATTAYHCLFLVSVFLQLVLYCSNGQKIGDESLQVAPEIYFAFDWSTLPKSCKKILLIVMMRAQRSCQLKGGFFVLDLSLFLWVFKTAGSLVTALKTLDENKE